MENKGFRALAVGALVACLVALALGVAALAQTQKFGGASHFSELSIVGNQSIGGTLAVTGATTLTGNIVLSTASTTGLISANSLSVLGGGATTLTGTLAVTGNTVFTTASSTGLLSLNSLSVLGGGATTLTGTLGVTGASTMVGAQIGYGGWTRSTLSVTSTSAFSGTMQATTINASTQVSSTQLTVGQGTPILTAVFATGTRDFDSISGTNNLTGSVTSTLLTVTGAVTGDPCYLSLPYWGSEPAAVASTSTLAWSCKVVATNTVSIAARNTASSTAEDIPSRTFGATVFHFNK